MAESIAYVRTDEAPRLPAPSSTVGIWAYFRDRLFSSIPNAILTILVGVLLAWIFWNIFEWAVIRGVWSGVDREACAVEGAGACWPFVWAKFPQWIYGFYPIDQRWRVNITYLLLALGLVALLIPKIPYKGWTVFFLLVIFPVLTFVLVRGGWFGLSYVETSDWGGLLVTLVVALTGMVASLPLGILLALGRRSKLPIIKTLCVTFIETVRGVPLITVLFMASVMFPLFMPPGTNFDKLLRALIGVALFSSAYMAETVRGGLQAIPNGQYEGAQALGLPYWKMMRLIVMPQALKIVIPGIVNTFIGNFKDTSLVAVIGIFDLLNMVQSGFNDAKWASPQTGNTGYFALAAIYWLFCFSMSRYSLYIERKLHTGHKR
jgi:general L-amino acid transport system permease protein